MSLFTPNVRFTEVVEDGISGGNVIPADFEPTPEGLAKVRENILKSNYMGRLVANDFSAAIVVAELLEVNPNTGEKLNYIDVATQLEGIRAKVQRRSLRRGLRLSHHRFRQGHRRHRRRCRPGGALLPHRLRHHPDLRLVLLPEHQAHPRRRRLLFHGRHLAVGDPHPARIRNRPHVHPGAVPGLRHRSQSWRTDGQRLPRRGLRRRRQPNRRPFVVSPAAHPRRHRSALRHHRFHHHYVHQDPDDSGDGHHCQPRRRHDHPHRSDPGARSAVLRPSPQGLPDQDAAPRQPHEPGMGPHGQGGDTQSGDGDHRRCPGALRRRRLEGEPDQNRRSPRRRPRAAPDIGLQHGHRRHHGQLRHRGWMSSPPSSSPTPRRAPSTR